MIEAVKDVDTTTADPAVLKAMLLAELSNKGGGTTRYLCNHLFMKTTENFIIRPGDHRMKQVYGLLNTLRKKGMVTSDYPGRWVIKTTKQND